MVKVRALAPFLVVAAAAVSGCWWQPADLACETDANCPRGLVCDLTQSHAATGQHACAEAPREADGDDDDIADDDDTAPVIDFSTFEGFEFINIDWDQQTRPGGVDDCIEDDGWEVYGAETTVDDQSRCPACDHIWTLTHTRSVGLVDCLDQTGLTPDTNFQRKLGFAFDGDQDFAVWRNFEDPANSMQQIGVGALREDATFTWSGGADYRFSEQPNLDYYFSGEGEF